MEKNNDKALVFFASLLAMLYLWASDMYLPAFNGMSRDLLTSEAKIGYSLSIYFLAFAFSQVFFGSVSDQLGRRPMLIIGAVIFILGSFVCMISGSIFIFYTGRILMAVGALESLGILYNFADMINETISNQDVVIVLLGYLSAVIDNVPLVAASIGMFPNVINDPLWHGIAYSAGTGGSMLIIGSAAGVVAMGMEKMDFFWYIKKITIFAMIGFWAGYGTFILMRDFVL